jgi:hypothetical protein
MRGDLDSLSTGDDDGNNDVVNDATTDDNGDNEVYLATTIS